MTRALVAVVLVGLWLGPRDVAGAAQPALPVHGASLAAPQQASGRADSGGELGSKAAASVPTAHYVIDLAPHETVRVLTVAQSRALHASGGPVMTLARLMVCESNGDASAVGAAGERGAFQVIERYWGRGPGLARRAGDSGSRNRPRTRHRAVDDSRRLREVVAAVKPYYEQDGITIYHGDCREVLPLLEPVDLVLTDPPYGIGWKPRVNHQDSPWLDSATADVRSLLTARFHCIWGGNYFSDQLPPRESWLIWIKRPAGYNFDNDERSYAVCEMAWTDFGGKPRMRHQVWDGGLRAGDASNRDFSHPAQKPLELMRWCIELAPSAASVLDPFMGSGTTLRAAKDLGRRAIGIEIEERYCEIAANRLAQSVLALGDAR